MAVLHLLIQQSESTGNCSALETGYPDMAIQIMKVIGCY